MDILLEYNNIKDNPIEVHSIILSIDSNKGTNDMSKIIEEIITNEIGLFTETKDHYAQGKHKSNINYGLRVLSQEIAKHSDNELCMTQSGVKIWSNFNKAAISTDKISELYPSSLDGKQEPVKFSDYVN